jgi:hypothetical protein
VVFFVILTPLGLLRRLLGKDALGRQPNRAIASYRLETPTRARERMKEPF